MKEHYVDLFSSRDALEIIYLYYTLSSIYKLHDKNTPDYIDDYFACRVQQYSDMLLLTKTKAP